MIQISIHKTKEINQIIIKGHAGYSVSGKDIVCASVSSILITTINAILRVDETAISYDKKEGYVALAILKHTELIDILVDNMLCLMKELEQDYPKYVKINE